MRIIHKDLEEGMIKLATENLDDLWHLQHIINPGDLLTSFTWRRPESENDKLRPERREKERVKLTIKVKDIEFQKFSHKLRVLGIIKKGKDLGNHHAIKLGTDSKFTITKNWKPHQLNRLQEAVKASKRPKVLLVALDDETATFGLVRQYGLEKLSEITSESSGKQYESNREQTESEYLGKVCSAIKNYMKTEETPSVIIAGPGFFKKKVQSALKEDYPEIAEKTHLGNTSGPGESGLNEIIRRGIVERVSEEDRISRETDLVNRMMEEISKDGETVYGGEKVKMASESGAVQTLLVSDEVLREESEKVESIIESTRNTGGEVFIISSEHEAGEQLRRLGGLGALLRYKIS